MKANKISTEQIILRRLKKESHSYLSGQALSKTLGLSRTAIWKHINAIKDMGYDINASPAKGYRLNLQNLPFNAIEINSNLKTSFIGRGLSFYNELDSTNDTAREAALRGAKEGYAVVADSQKKGRGRLGRRWESRAGVNIYTSIILRPAIPPAHAPQFTLVAAVAVAETIAEYLNSATPSFAKRGRNGFLNEKVEVKWPNDILINLRKSAGILTEMNAETDRINFVILGIGVNLNTTGEMFSEDLKGIAISLKEVTGRDVPRVEFIQALYLNIEKWYKKYLKEGFKEIREAWLSYFRMAGKAVRVCGTDKVIKGTALGIDSDGAFLLEAEDGNSVRIIAGDVVF